MLCARRKRATAAKLIANELRDVSNPHRTVHRATSVDVLDSLLSNQDSYESPIADSLIDCIIEGLEQHCGVYRSYQCTSVKQ